MVELGLVHFIRKFMVHLTFGGGRDYSIGPYLLLWNAQKFRLVGLQVSDT